MLWQLCSISPVLARPDLAGPAGVATATLTSTGDYRSTGPGWPSAYLFSLLFPSKSHSDLYRLRVNKSKCDPAGTGPAPPLISTPTTEKLLKLATTPLLKQGASNSSQFGVHSDFISAPGLPEPPLLLPAQELPVLVLQEPQQWHLLKPASQATPASMVASWHFWTKEKNRLQLQQNMMQHSQHPVHQQEPPQCKKRQQHRCKILLSLIHWWNRKGALNMEKPPRVQPCAELRSTPKIVARTQDTFLCQGTLMMTFANW